MLLNSHEALLRSATFCQLPHCYLVTHRWLYTSVAIINLPQTGTELVRPYRIKTVMSIKKDQRSNQELKLDEVGWQCVQPLPAFRGLKTWAKGNVTAMRGGSVTGPLPYLGFGGCTGRPATLEFHIISHKLG